MKRNKLFWIPLTTVFCLMTTHFSVKADLEAHKLEIARIVNQFNGADNTGFYFSTHDAPATIQDKSLRNLVFEPRAGVHVDIDAYMQGPWWANDGGKNVFYTFRCDRNGSAAQDLPGKIATFAKLYQPVEIEINSRTILPTFYGSELAPKNLTLGAAFLYAQFVQGEGLFSVDVFNDNNINAAEAFREALLAMHNRTNNNNGYWNGNMYLSWLLTIPGYDRVDNWFDIYNLLGDYSAIGFGDYYIFAMHVWQYQDEQAEEYASMFYAAPRYSDPPPVQDVPEPATLLLWTLGGLGLSGTSWLRRRHKKKVVPA